MNEPKLPPGPWAFKAKNHESLPAAWPGVLNDCNGRYIGSFFISGDDTTVAAIMRILEAAPDLIAFAACQRAWEAATVWGKDRPSFRPTFLAHGWDGKEDPTSFLTRIRDEAIAKATQGPPSAAGASS